MEPIHFRNITGPDDAPALVAVHDARYATDRLNGELYFEDIPTVDGYREQLATADPRDWIVVQSGADVIGYGHCLSPWAENNGKRVYLHLGWMKPEWRGKNIGRDLLSRLEARCHEKMDQDGVASGDRELAANASGTEVSAQRLLRATGYHIVYTAIEMRFVGDAQTLPPAPLPNDLSLRPVLPEHYRALWQCIGDAYYVHGGDNSSRGTPDEAHFNRYFNGDSADPSLWFAAWEPSRIAGVVLCRVENNVADVYEVSVAHAHRRKGLAKALLTTALRELLARNVSAIRLITWRENPTEAWRLYEAVGFQTVKDFPRWRKPVV